MDYRTAIELFRYDPATGVVKWADHLPRHLFDSDKGWKIMNSRQAGTAITCTDTGGYIQVRWKGKAYRLHRVIWMLVHGVWPVNHIDHKDQCRTNNRITNLRDIPQEHNNAHKKTNKSGHSGIFENKRNTNRPWMVQVFTKGKYVTQQSFADLQDAINHRDEVRRQHGLSQL